MIPVLCLKIRRSTTMAGQERSHGNKYDQYKTASTCRESGERRFSSPPTLRKQENEGVPSSQSRFAGTEQVSAATAQSPSRARSLPGAFHITHPDALEAAEGGTSPVAPSRRFTMDESDDEESTIVVVIPNARIVEDTTMNAHVTTGELVRASPVVHFDGDVKDSSMAGVIHPDKMNKSGLVATTKKPWYRRRWVMVLLVLLLLLGLVTSVTISVLQSKDGSSRSVESPLSQDTSNSGGGGGRDTDGNGSGGARDGDGGNNDGDRDENGRKKKDGGGDRQKLRKRKSI